MTTRKLNAVHCHVCETTIKSTHRHDFRRCACPTDDTAVWVDGGFDYKRRMHGDNANFTEIDRDVVSEGPVQLEHSDVMLHVHNSALCAGEVCTVHNRSNHSKRSWVQHWNSKRIRMERVSPVSGRHYVDPDSPRRA